MFVVGYPINFTITGDKTNQAIAKHIREIQKIYNHLNDNAVEIDKAKEEYISLIKKANNKIDATKDEVVEELSEDISSFNTKVDTMIEELKFQYGEELTNAVEGARQSSNEASAILNSMKGLECEAWDNAKIYQYPDVVAYEDGYTYRCVSVTSLNEQPSLSNSWVRISTSLNDFFEVDMEGNLMPSEYPIYSWLFELDGEGNIQMKEG